MEKNRNPGSDGLRGIGRDSAARMATEQAGRTHGARNS